MTRPRFLNILAALLCLIGTISFVIELSHWIFDHHLSLIASFPILSVPHRPLDHHQRHDLQAPSGRRSTEFNVTTGRDAAEDVAAYDVILP